MKILNPRKVEIENRENKEKDSCVKKFPEIDPDEKKKKQELDDPQITAPMTTPISIDRAIIPSEKEQGTLKGLAEIATPVAAKIICMKKDRGITKTHFIVETKRFGEVEIDLTMYDTAPHSFHLKLYGTKEIQELSMSHQNILHTNIKQAIPRINILIAPPALRKRDRFPTKQKKSIEKTPSSLYGKVSKGKSS
ncbi:MAG: hypothetical protein SP4CHLAM5_09760 [Chlamydiia bacterium]|nr:hypothetical protein [Chlamydiia bacterium]MCH9618834.1 hypothetical protein [Chlamydiia bacterium]MCH9624364.1 hypothetical protein [Chlamydiia bacterium]